MPVKNSFPLEFSMRRLSNMRVCNIVFEGDVPQEVLLKMASSGCGHSLRLPRRVRATVYYDPECPACKRLFIFMMEIGNLEVRGVPFLKGVNKIIAHLGKVVIPFTILDNGRWIRGCPHMLDELYQELLSSV